MFRYYLIFIYHSLRYFRAKKRNKTLRLKVSDFREFTSELHTKDINTLKLIVKHYCAISGRNFDHQISLLTKHLEKFNQHQENKKVLKKIFNKKNISLKI